MFGFIEKISIGLLSICITGSFSGSLVSNSKGLAKCVLINHWPCQARPILVNINLNQILYHPFTASIDKCRGSYSTIDSPYPRVCVPDKVKNMNVRVSNLMSGANETRFLVQHESCECKWIKWKCM